MQKVTQIPSCLTDSAGASLRLLVKVSEAPLTQDEGYRRVRRSAAMIGLAISMTAMGIVLSNQATATTTTGNTQLSLADLSDNLESETNVNTASKEKTTDNNLTQTTSTALKLPALKYEVQQGESINQVGAEIQTQPIAISTANTIIISPPSELITGKISKIPITSSKNLSTEAQPYQTTLVPSVIENPRNLNSPQSQEEKTAKLERYNQASSNQVSSNNVARVTLTSPVPEKDAIADISDVSQPLQIIENQSTNPSILRQSSSNRQFSIATGTFDRPIPIAVPTPETQGLPSVANVSLPQLKAPIPLSSPPTVLSLPRKPENDAFPQSSQAIAVTKLESLGNNSDSPQNAGETKIPIAISVPTPETASLPNIPRLQENLLTPPLKTPFFNQSIPSNNESNNQLAVYEIKPGDTIASIAQQHNVSSTVVIKANQLSNPNLIKVHQNLVIPQPNNTNPIVTSQASNLNNLATIPIPVTLAAPRISIKAVEPTQSISISVDAPTSTYATTKQLKNDVAHLQQSYGSESRPLIIPVEKVAQISNYPETLENEEINPEWKETTTNKAWQNSPSPRTQTVSRNPLQQLQRRYPPSVRPSGVSQSQIIGSAPIDVEDYNDSFHIPVGQEVSPDLPPLSTPDFPDAPTNLTGGYIWPAKGVLSSGYGRRWGRMHRGIDIAAPIGTPIVAAAPGQVVAAGWSSGGYGNLVKIRHVDGSVTFYAHNSRILVRQGQEVAQGQQISEMGSTGRSTGPHLHFEVRPNGEIAANPIAYLPNSRS